MYVRRTHAQTRQCYLGQPAVNCVASLLVFGVSLRMVSLSNASARSTLKSVAAIISLD